MRFRFRFWRITGWFSSMVKLILQSKGFIKMFLKMFRDECNIQHFKLKHDVPEEFTTCYWQKTAGIKKYWIAYRVLLCMYFIMTFIFILGEQENLEGTRKVLLFLTNWTFLGQTMTFTYALGLVVERRRLERRYKDTPIPGMTKLPIQYTIFWVAYSAVAGGSMVVSIIFWLFIYTPENFRRPVHTLSTHLMNFLFMVLDFFLVSFPMRFLHFYIPLVYCFIYGTFTIIYQLSGGTGTKGQIPIYIILDWRYPGKALVTCLIVLTATSLSHCSFCLIQALKQYLRKFPPPSYPKPDEPKEEGQATAEAGQSSKEAKSKRPKWRTKKQRKPSETDTQNSVV